MNGFSTLRALRSRVRRPATLVTALAFALTLALAGAQEAAEADVTVTLSNVGASAWTVDAVDGADGVVPTDEQNPTITLTVGTRYAFDTSGVDSDFHPFDLRDAEGAILLGQGDTEGSLEGDEAIAWEESADMVAFTVTEALAEAVAQYRCTVHATMVGSVEIAEAM